METTWINVLDVCTSHKIEVQFIRELSENGLIEIRMERDIELVNEEELKPLEQFAAWHYDLELNMQGIEVACHLLDRIASLQQEIATLKKLQERI